MEKANLDLFNPKKAELVEVAAQYKDLTINGIDDKEGFKKVHEAQMVLKNHRVNIKKTRLDYTRQFDEAKRQAMDLEKSLLEIITPIEDNLKEQKELIEAEKEKIKQEEAEEKRKFIQDRVDQLAYEDYIHHDLFELSQMSDEDFAKLLSEKKEIAKEKAEKVAQEQKEEEERREKEKKEREEFEEKQRKFEADQKALEEEKQKMQDEKDQIEKEKQERIRKENEEKRIEEAKKEAAEQTKKDLEEQEKNTQQEIERMSEMTIERVREMFHVHKSCSPLYNREKLLDYIKSRIDEDDKQKDQEKLEKETKYKNFLKKNEGKFDGFFDKDGKRILYKIIDEFSF